MANINEFKSRLKGGGARANQFKVTLPFPGYSSVGGETSDLSFLCTATAIPGQDIPMVTVAYRGRQLKLAGDSRTFGNWTMTVINDTDFKIYRAFERWMNGINNMTDNEGLTNPNDYQVDGFVDHLDRDGNSIKQYQLRGCFPTSLDGIALSYGTNDAVEDFGVTLAYQYFETDTTT
jgi:hypothetical protein